MNSLHKLELTINDLLPYITKQLALGKNVILAPRGTSMLPLIRQGLDKVILKAKPTKLNKYDIILFRRNDGKFVLHRIIIVDNKYCCIGDNQFVYECNISEKQIIAVVKGIYRKNHYISTNNLIYRLYCIIWYKTISIRRFINAMVN